MIPDLYCVRTYTVSFCIHSPPACTESLRPSAAPASLRTVPQSVTLCQSVSLCMRRRPCGSPEQRKPCLMRGAGSWRALPRSPVHCAPPPRASAAHEGATGPARAGLAWAQCARTFGPCPDRADHGVRAALAKAHLARVPMLARLVEAAPCLGCCTLGTASSTLAGRFDSLCLLRSLSMSSSRSASTLFFVGLLNFVGSGSQPTAFIVRCFETRAVASQR